MTREEEPLLTQEEVDALPIGTRVVITWSGGNGPHEYKIVRREHGTSYIKESNPNAGWWDGQIDFVGKESYHTHVSLLKTNL